MKSYAIRGTLLVAACAACHAVTAADFHYVGASNEWNTAACYSTEAGGTGGVGIPGDDDRIVISEGQTVFIDDTNIGFFASVKEVHVALSGATVHVSLEEDAELDCLFGFLTGSDRNRCRSSIVKTGPGTLTLTHVTPDEHTSSNGENYFGYYIGFDVREGAVDLGPKTGNRRHRFGVLKIASGAVVKVPHSAITCPDGLSGGGVLTNAAGAGELRIVGETAEPYVFSGKIAGFSSLRPTGHLWLTGTENTTAQFSPFYHDGSLSRGVTGFMTWAGDETTPSSLGLGNWNGNGPARIRYLGTTGETIERTLTAVNTADAPNVIDGGEHGGLVFTGAFEPDDGTAKQQRLELTGSHVNACVLSNKLGKAGSGDDTASFFLRKTGTGTWRLCDREDNEMSGTVRVDGGTLEFDSVRPAGLRSALGDATDLYNDACALPSGLTSLDCALYAGAEEGEAVLSYTGLLSPTVYGRPIGVCGNARFKAPNCNALIWNGVRGETSGDGNIAFECAEGQTFRVANVSDGNGSAGSGTLSVEKDGAGELILSGELSFGGDLVVNAGTVKVMDVSGMKYSWYRLVLKENVASSPLAEYSDFTVLRTVWSSGVFSRSIYLSEFGLYGEDGGRLNAYGGTDVDCASVAELKNRQIALENRDMMAMYTVNYTPAQLLNNYRVSGYVFIARWADVYRNPVADDPSSWFKVVLRMDSEAAAASSFDLSYVYVPSSDNDAFASTPTAFSVEGSADGCTWEDLYSTNDISFKPTGAYAWLSDGSCSGKVPEETDHGRIPLASTAVRAQYEVLGNVRSLKVASGAELVCEGAERPVVAGLWIDAPEGLGTISGIDLAEDGELRIDGTDGGKNLFFPADLSGVSGRDRLSGWDISIDGKPVTSCFAAMTETGISVKPRGLVFTVR